MKTNNIILRPMGQFQVEQRTKDGMFNATALLKQWNLNTQKNGYLKEKGIDNFLNNNNVQEFIKALIEEESLPRKSRCYVTVRGKNGGTWMHPLLFFKFAMWLNPRFEVKVIKFIHDQMIKYRIEAGDESIRLASAINKIVGKTFMPVAMPKLNQAINCIVFGEHQTMMRNKVGTEEKQRELVALERKISDLINEGFITNFESLLNYLRKLWRQKYLPTQLT